MAPKILFTLREAAELSGLRPPMVDYLCRQGILPPTGPTTGPRSRGRARSYTFGDVVMLRVLAGLLRSGISVARLKRSLEALRKFHPEITPTSLPSRYLVTDGQRVFLRNKANALETLDRNGQLVFAFVIELRSVRDEVARQIRNAAA